MKPSIKKFFSIIVFLIILISIPVSLYLIKQSQDVRSRASAPSRTLGYDAQQFRGIGFNSFFERDVTYNLTKKANGKWIRVLFYWTKAEPSPGEYKTGNGEYLGKNGEFENQIKFWKDKGFNVSAVLMGSPKWTNGWWEKLSDEEREAFGLSDINQLSENNGPLNDLGKKRLTLISQKIMTDFPQIDLWETRNEPNIPIEGWRTGNTEVSWHGFFGFNISKNGQQVKVLPNNFNETDYSLIGAKEYAEYQKAFYLGKINARSQIPIAYAGSMWAYVGSSPENKNKLDHNFDRWVFKYLKDVCPENGCFDVMNFHYYNPGDGLNNSCLGGTRLVQSNPQPNAASREDLFKCHDPYANSALKGKIRRIKYDMQDILGVTKPLFTSEIGYAWNHNKNNPNYLNEVRGAQGGWIKQLTEARAEGVDGIIQYELAGAHNPHEALLVDTYPDGSRYDPSKPEGAVYYTFSKMTEFLNNYNFVKYGGLNPISRDESAANRKNVISYVFKNKDIVNNPNLYMEVIWNKSNDVNATTQVIIPRRTGGNLGTITLYRINPQNPEGLDVSIIDPNTRTFELKGNNPIIVTYHADNSTETILGRVESNTFLSANNGWVNLIGSVISQNKAIDRIELHIDGVKRDELPYGLIKDSVCRGNDGHLKPDFQYSQCPFVGFGGNINIEVYRLSEGDHRVEVIAFDSLGNRLSLVWGNSNQTFGTLNFKVTTQPTPTPVSSPTATPSAPPIDGPVGVVIQNFDQNGDQSAGDQNNDRVINVLDFGAVYSR